MADVAAEAHVSVKTVSRVVNGEPGVRPDTAERVRAVIERLGFRRNDGARLMRQGRTFTIALVVEDLANPFYSQVGAAVEREARIRAAPAHHGLGRGLAVARARRHRGPSWPAASTASSSCPPARAHRRTPSSRRATAPPSSTWTARSAATPRDTVLSDNARRHPQRRRAPRRARPPQHRLPRRRPRRSGRRGSAATPSSRPTRALGLPGDPRVAMGPHGEPSCTPCSPVARGPEPITAVITGNNRITLSALHALREIGSPMSLVGYDDFELADLIDPPVTVVHQDPTAMGRRPPSSSSPVCSATSRPPRRSSCRPGSSSAPPDCDGRHRSADLSRSVGRAADEGPDRQRRQDAVISDRPEDRREDGCCSGQRGVGRQPGPLPHSSRRAWTRAEMGFHSAMVRRNGTMPRWVRTCWRGRSAGRSP